MTIRDALNLLGYDTTSIVEDDTLVDPTNAETALLLPPPFTHAMGIPWQVQITDGPWLREDSSILQLVPNMPGRITFGLGIVLLIRRKALEDADRPSRESGLDRTHPDYRQEDLAAQELLHRAQQTWALLQQLAAARDLGPLPLYETHDDDPLDD